LEKIRFLANMNISPKSVDALRRQGWDIIRVSELLPVNATDQEILDLGRQKGRVVVTQDLDFSTLLALGGYNRPSLITLRLSVSDPDTVTARLQEVVLQFEESLQEGSVVTIEDVVVRVRKLPTE
jgi:predicted nuclease of predicted toxin-antitoxin system